MLALLLLIFTAAAFAQLDSGKAAPQPKTLSRTMQREVRIEVQEEMPVGKLLVVSDVVCHLQANGKVITSLEAGTPATVTLPAGQVLLTAQSADGKQIWEKIVQIRAGWQSAALVNVQQSEDLAAIIAPQPLVREDLPEGIQFVLIPSGTANLGCVPGDGDCRSSEGAWKTVTIPKNYWLTDTEVTVSQFDAYTRDTRSRMPAQPKWNGPLNPVVNVLWSEARAFCRWIGGRLPNEQEWEFAARSTSIPSIYVSGAQLDRSVANFGQPTCCGGQADGPDRWESTAPVRSFPSSARKLYDISGNVWEWMEDAGPASGASLRAVRGGSWSSPPKDLRISRRNALSTDLRFDDTGFRCAADSSH
jgi:formylglycine-generating enzyme required for sulfatase activity